MGHLEAQAGITPLGTLKFRLFTPRNVMQSSASISASPAPKLSSLLRESVSPPNTAFYFHSPPVLSLTACEFFNIVNKAQQNNNKGESHIRCDPHPEQYRGSPHQNSAHDASSAHTILRPPHHLRLYSHNAMLHHPTNP